MEAVRTIVTAQLRRGWRGWLALSLAIGLAAGGVITAASGARRSSTAYRRLVAWSNPFHTATGGLAAGEEAFLPGIEAIERLPQVADSARFYAPALEVRSAGGEPIRNINVVVVPLEVAATIDYRVKYVGGRAPRIDRADEASIGFAAENDALGIGDVVKVVLYRDQDSPSPDRIVPVRIVGVHAAPDEFPSVNQITFPSLALSPAFFTTYRDLIPDDSSHMGLAVHLKRGAADFPAFRDAVIARRIPIEFPATLTDTVSGVEKTLRFESSALWLLAGLLGLAAFAIFGQALGRQALADHGDHVTLGALGMTRTQLFASGLARAGLMGIFAALVAVPAAIVASTLTPIGIARLAEPFPGVRIDLPVLLLGAAATLALVVVAAVPGAYRVARIGRSPLGARSGDGPAPARLVRALARAGAPVTAVSGARMASESATFGRSTPVRSAMLSAAVGVAALVMSFVFVASLGRLVDDPRLSGMVWDVQVAGAAEAADSLRKDARVTDVGVGGGINVEIGDQRMLAFTYDERSTIRPVIVEGRAPRGDAEIALGRTTMRRIDAAIGSTIPVDRAGSRSAGERHYVELTVVGEVIVPGFFFETHEPGVGAALTAAAAARIDPPPEGEYSYLIRFEPGVTLDDVLAGPHGEEISETIFFVVPAQRPADLAVLKGVSNLPVVLSGLLAAMAAATLAHALVTTVRQRRGDLAILRTLGFLRRQARATVAWQTSIMIVVALIVGVPAGLVAGRWLWRVFVNGLALLPEPRVSTLAVALVVPGALLLGNVIAAGPARAAARVRPAVVLRTE